MLVLSMNKAKTPDDPSEAKVARSIISSSTGVKSTLKSPVNTIVPIGVFTAKATESAIL